MFPKARHKRRGQCGRQLQVLVSKQQRSDCGVHTKHAKDVYKQKLKWFNGISEMKNLPAQNDKNEQR